MSNRSKCTVQRSKISKIAHSCTSSFRTQGLSQTEAICIFRKAQLSELMRRFSATCLDRPVHALVLRLGRVTATNYSYKSCKGNEGHINMVVVGEWVVPTACFKECAPFLVLLCCCLEGSVVKMFGTEWFRTFSFASTHAYRNA